MQRSGSEDRSIDVVDGRLFKPLVFLSVPIVLAEGLDMVYFLVDLYWIGHLGTDAVAAMAYAWPVIYLGMSVGFGIVTAGTVLVAQYKGTGQLRAISSAAGGTISFVTILSGVLAVTGYALTPWLLTLVGAVPETAPHTLAVQYTRITFLGLVPMFWFLVFNALARGWGDTRTPLALMGVSTAINVLVDPFLIHGFAANPLFEWVGLGSLETALYAQTGFAGYGIEGAAIATVVARSVAAALGLYILFSGRIGFRLTLGSLRLRRETVVQILKIGSPTVVEMTVRAAGVAVLTAILAIEGAAAVAAYGISEYLVGILFVISLGLARGVEAIVGQNLGAGKVARANRAVYLSAGIAVVLFTGIVAVSYPFAESIVSVFLAVESGDVAADAIVQGGVSFIWIVGPALIFFAVFQVILGAFRGSGNTTLAMVMATLELLVFRVPLSYAALVWFEAGITGVWYAIAFSYVVASVLAVVWFFRGTWLPSSVPLKRSSGDGSPHRVTE
ncbi:Multi antimicrobial extrusion protein (Na(+)/drug antiporter), MATE family of MDR efflux pumps [Natrarchaeobaculum sulfurireducens]|uniref:Multi antimicrobial extrusion protein (Na(+)/drug antiporter), MATE family of MDR efflux pumps n=1 Tax=Natrarchaeobaculum sulfurireducens TaxID=2044521 RepID=A0A346PHU3_9EURY|nr:Na+-driven multidrug efflux pump [Natrarchaeobaculum sulfurireducens]AXR80886.1 Multi antimicrobial extrusion protein (Na(+)/drug antiporter), MATE family of MDR efflux pumps [Natrarchaeobaculum sulfurireducens]